MEKAILKTLIYSDIFDYPLNLSEIHKWLIGKKATPRDIEKTLKELIEKRKRESSPKIKKERDYFYINKSQGIVLKRKRRERQSIIYIRKVKIISHLLKLIPWIKLVGISGGLAMENTDRNDDIDLFLITSKKRLWISRLLVLGILNILGQRRKVDDNLKKTAGKICCNIILEEDYVEQKRKDLYTAHEVLQMKPLMVRDGIYSKYLEDNNWVFKFLPNWVGENVQGKMYNVKLKKNNSKLYIVNYTFGWLENLAKRFQLKIMGKPKGMERIEDGALYFHPNDIREKILKEYNRRSSRL